MRKFKDVKNEECVWSEKIEPQKDNYVNIVLSKHLIWAVGECFGSKTIGLSNNNVEEVLVVNNLNKTTYKSSNGSVYYSDKEECINEAFNEVKEYCTKNGIKPSSLSNKIIEVEVI